MKKKNGCGTFLERIGMDCRSELFVRADDGFDDRRRVVNRNGETDAFDGSGSDLTVVDAYDCACAVHQRTAAVARVDRRIRLDEREFNVLRVFGTTNAADDPDRDTSQKRFVFDRLSFSPNLQATYIYRVILNFVENVTNVWIILKIDEIFHTDSPFIIKEKQYFHIAPN